MYFSNEGQEKTLYAYVRSEDGKVYARSINNDPREFLMYDFNLQPGDLVSVYLCLGIDSPYKNLDKIHPYIVHCVNRYKITSNGHSFEVIEFDEHCEGMADDWDCNYLTGQWIVGVGSDAGPFYNIYLQLAGGGSMLDKVTISDDLVYSNEDVQIDPANVNQLMDSEESAEYGPSYNIDGTLHSEGQKGLYIRNGKKFIAR